VGLEGKTLPRDAAPQCAGHCQALGLALDSVVIMADNVGCVCRPLGQHGAPGSASACAANGASSGGGVTAVMMARKAADNQHQHHQLHRHTSSR